MHISIIAALDRNALIGVEQRLPWRLPEDMRRFRRLTMGKPVLMGRKTFESIGRPLEGRVNIVLSRQRDYTAQGCTAVVSFEEGLQVCRNAAELMVLGGASVYALALPRATRMYLTLIDDAFEGDTYFPAYEPCQWHEVEREAHTAEQLGYSFVTLERAASSSAR